MKFSTTIATICYFQPNDPPILLDTQSLLKVCDADLPEHPTSLGLGWKFSNQLISDTLAITDTPLNNISLKVRSQSLIGMVSIKNDDVKSSQQVLVWGSYDNWTTRFPIPCICNDTLIQTQLELHFEIDLNLNYNTIEVTMDIYTLDGVLIGKNESSSRLCYSKVFNTDSIRRRRMEKRKAYQDHLLSTSSHFDFDFDFEYWKSNSGVFTKTYQLQHNIEESQCNRVPRIITSDLMIDEFDCDTSSDSSEDSVIAGGLLSSSPIFSSSNLF
ncbi:hypothetical protein BC833DRAFT_579933 [Globomyces pollinis-pini]|nr:hypothetical protein BC833DRAFT_579933 [Globomyces pollinis-pini]KAJ3000541.1 hypothetical protein HDV02_004836 [Globomyces sp. JEL0801]